MLVFDLKRVQTLPSQSRGVAVDGFKKSSGKVSTTLKARKPAHFGYTHMRCVCLCVCVLIPNVV